MTRRGNPFDAEDLARVNAFAARRVIILHPHEDEVGLLGQGVHARDESDESASRIKELQFQREQREEALKATVILNLLNDKAHANPDVVVQMPYRLPDAQDLVGHALKITRSQDADADKMFGVSAPKDGAPDTRYVQVHGTENTGKISAFAAFQPGIARVFEVLFEQDDATPEFYLSAVSLFTLISIRAISLMTTTCFMYYRRRSSRASPSARLGACYPGRRCAVLATATGPSHWPRMTRTSFKPPTRLSYSRSPPRWT